MDWETLLLSLIITSAAYLFIPIILCLTCKEKFSNKQILTITIVNGAILWLIFMIIRINAGKDGSSGAVVLWSSIAYWLLRKNCLKISNSEPEDETQNQALPEDVIKKCDRLKGNVDKLKGFLDSCLEKGSISVSQHTELFQQYSYVTYVPNHTETVKKNRKPVITGTIVWGIIIIIPVLIAILVANNSNKEIHNISLRTITFSEESTAEYVYSTWQNGNATEQSLVELMNKYGAKQGDQGAGRLYFAEPGDYVEEIDEWCFSPKRKVGDCTIIKNDYGYTICYISELNPKSDNSIDLTLANSDVEYLSNYRFLYYDDFSKFVLLFELSDENENPVSASGTVEIRIVNDNNVTVYNKNRNFTKANFEEWTYDGTDEKCLAAIYIEPKDITSGGTQFGTVYFTVSGENYSFEETSIFTSGLPTKSNITPQTNNNTNNNTSKYTCADILCDNNVAKSGAYCSEHACAQSGCSNEKSYNSKYCSNHQCLATSCDNAKIELGLYCSDHTCAQSGCLSSKTDDSQYCYSHQCSALGCGKQKMDLGSYCSDHTCAQSGCLSKKSDYSLYCISHHCLFSGCGNHKLDSGNYCSEHACAQSGCQFSKSGNSDYCTLHQQERRKQNGIYPI